MGERYEFGGQTAGQPSNDDFFRLYGDVDGDGFTDFDDFAGGFLPAFGSSQATTPGFRADLDNNGDGFVDFNDFADGFLPNFGANDRDVRARSRSDSEIDLEMRLFSGATRWCVGRRLPLNGRHAANAPGFGNTPVRGVC